MGRFPGVLAAALLVACQPVAASNSNTDAAGATQMDTLANPIRRVVTLLQKMSKKLDAEGKKEEELYDKFMCYCKTGSADLAASIDNSDAKIPQVQSDIEESEAEEKQLRQDLTSHQTDRAAAKEAMAAATSQREKEHKGYLAESTEHKTNIGALDKAIPAIEKGMAGGFLQAKAGVGAQLAAAVAASTSVTDYDRQAVSAFLSGGRVAATDEDGESYVPAGGEIVGILKTIKADFDKTLAEVEATEADSVKVFDELMAAKTKQVNALTQAIEKKTVRVGDLGVQIVSMKSDLTDTQAALIEDTKFAANLEQNCKTKTAEWDIRVKTRGEEMVAIQETIKILNDDDALELFKKTLPSSSLLQVSTAAADAQRKALGIVRGTKGVGNRAGLDFLAMALSGKKIDFSKVVKMIDDMVSLLKQEQADDDNKKEYCAIQIDAIEDKAKGLEKKIGDLEASIADAEELLGTVVGELKTLAKGIKDLDKSVMDASVQRKDEHAEYTELMTNNNAAIELLGFAKNRLNKFYQPGLYKAPPKRELSEQDRIAVNMGGTMAPTPAPGGIAGTGISALEEVPAFVQISLHSRSETMNVAVDAPAPAPDTWEGGYNKKSEETTGVIAMVDLLVRDLEKENTEAETDEKNSQQSYEEMMQDAAGKRAADTKSIREKEAAKANAEATKERSSEELRLSVKEHMATKQYEGQLHMECDWLMQNYDLRQQARAEEMDSLKQAKAVLAGAKFD